MVSAPQARVSASTTFALGCGVTWAEPPPMMVGVERVGTEQCDPTRRRARQRQNAVIREQDRCLSGGMAEQIAMSSAVGGLGAIAGAGPSSAPIRSSPPRNRPTAASRSASSTSPFLTASTTVAPELTGRARHLEIESGSQRRGRFGHAEPVGHHQALESPLVAQDVEEQRRLLGQPAAVQPVVRRHDGERPALADGDLEGDEVELAECAFVDDRADGSPFELGLIARRMLDGGEDALGLDTLHVPGGETSRQ